MLSKVIEAEEMENEIQRNQKYQERLRKDEHELQSGIEQDEEMIKQLQVGVHPSNPRNSSKWASRSTRSSTRTTPTSPPR